VDGVLVSSKGNITLTNVTADGNGTHGATLENISGSGNVTIDGSANSFSDAVWYGLYVASKGDITLTNVAADGNGYSGAQLDNTFGSGNVAINGSANSFSDNMGLYGLDVASKGAITLTNVTADGNRTSGATLDNTSGSSDVTINGTSNSFSDNTGSYGLAVASKGAVTLTNVTADGNRTSGATLDNTSGSGDMTINGTANSFSNNIETGLTINSYGDVNLSGVTANGNRHAGAQVGGSPAFIAGDVTISDSTFNANRDGLDVEAVGSITITNVTADSNGSFGAGLIGDVFVTINGSGNSFSGNGDSGVVVGSINSITLTNVTANSNGLGGAGLYCYGDVTINGSSNSFSGNLAYDGLGIFADGAVALTNVTANDNDRFGVAVNPSLGSVPTGVTLTNVSVDNNGFVGIYVTDVDGNVTLTDATATNNLDSGIVVGYVSGDVMLTNVTAEANDYDGADIGFVDGVSITGGSFSNNSADGIYVTNVGPVTIQEAKITQNDDYGVELESIASAAPVLININRIVGNGGQGVYYDGSGLTADATDNWWGCNYGPGATGTGCIGVTNGSFGDIDVNPWLILTMSPTTTRDISPDGGTLALIAYLTTNSDGVDISSRGSIPDGTPATFSTTLGTVGSSTTTKTTTSGVATATLTGGSTSGTAGVTIQVDGQVLRLAVLIVSSTESGVSAGSAPGGSDLVITITPLSLPPGNTFIAALNVTVTLNGTLLTELPGDQVIEISFDLPPGFTGTPVIWYQLPHGTWQAVQTFVVGNRAVAFVHMMGVYALGVQ